MHVTADTINLITHFSAPAAAAHVPKDTVFETDPRQCPLQTSEVELARLPPTRRIAFAAARGVWCNHGLDSSLVELDGVITDAASQRSLCDLNGSVCNRCSPAILTHGTTLSRATSTFVALLRGDLLHQRRPVPGSWRRDSRDPSPPSWPRGLSSATPLCVRTGPLILLDMYYVE